MRFRTRLGRAAAPPALIVAGTCLVVTTLAMGALSDGASKFAVPSGEVRERTATCERGQAVSGGFRAPIPGGNGPAVQALDSTREGSDGWRLRARNTGEKGKATAYAYCGRNDPPLTTSSSAPTLVAKDEKASIPAVCGSGEEAVAGGFESPDSPSFLVASKRTAPDTWELSVVNNSQDPQLYTAFAYCDSSEPDLKERTKSRAADGDGEKFNQTVAAGCPASRKLRSGGFEIEYNVVEPAENSDLGLVHGSRMSGDKWRLTAFAFLGHPEMTAYAYCD
jgi:hypothetical protein